MALLTAMRVIGMAARLAGWMPKSKSTVGGLLGYLSGGLSQKVRLEVAVCSTFEGRSARGHATLSGFTPSLADIVLHAGTSGYFPYPARW